MQFRNSLLPLFAMNLQNGMPQDRGQVRYLGVSFHFNDQGSIATCAHIVNSIRAGETLVAVEMYGDSRLYKVENIRCHPKYDFAVGRVGRINYEVLPIHAKRNIYIGNDVLSYGFTSDGSGSDGRLQMMPRLFKGHVVRLYDTPVLRQSRSTCEVSFPSLAGFSGTPLLFAKSRTSIAGMLYGNVESSILLHRFDEVCEGHNTFSEQIHRVVELGMAHTAYDIRVFLNDLGIERMALDSKTPDKIP